MSGVARKQAPRPAKPAGRYWKGKAPKGAAELIESDEEEEELVQEAEDEGADQFLGEIEEGAAVVTKPVGKMSVTLRDVNISIEGKVLVGGREEVGRTELEEESSEEEKYEAAPRTTLGKLAEEASEESSSEYETESEEEEKPKMQLRPVFIPKRGRVTMAEKDALALDSEEALKKKELEAEERRKQSHDMVADSIRRELAEKQKEEEIPDVDDTDALDPAAEFEAWHLRELARIKRDKEAELAREQEREEIERRRALPEEQRMKEDMERAQKLRDEKPKGQQVFLQKYWHKGAFHQDEEILIRHDYTEKTESTVDVSALPAVMQVKNFGKRGRTKYTHLLDQDTTMKTGGFGGAGSIKSGGKGTEGGGCFICGGPHLKRGDAILTPESYQDDQEQARMLRRRAQRAHGGIEMRVMRLASVAIDRGSAVGNVSSIGTGGVEVMTEIGARSMQVDVRTGTGIVMRDAGGVRSMRPVTEIGTGRRDESGGVGAMMIEIVHGRKGGDQGRCRESEMVDAQTGTICAFKGVIKLPSPVPDLTEACAFDLSDMKVSARNLEHCRLVAVGKAASDEVFAPYMPNESRRVVKVAIVGSGLAGLTAAYLLSNVTKRQHENVEEIEFEVHIFEKAESLGMDSNSVSLTLPGFSPKSEWRVDVPMRSFQGGYYTQLIALYRRLGVHFRTADFSYSFSYLPSLPASSTSHAPPKPNLAPTLIYDGASGRAGISIPTALRTWTHQSDGFRRTLAHFSSIFTIMLSILVLLYNFLRLNILAAPWFRSHDVGTLSWAAWVEHATPKGFVARLLGLDQRWREFIRDICVPLFSAVCTAAREDVHAHPAEEFLSALISLLCALFFARADPQGADFVWLTLGTHHYVVSNNVRDVVRRLTEMIPASQIHLGAPTVNIEPDINNPSLVSIICSSRYDGEVTYTGFSHVVFASQANHAAPIVRSYSRALQQQGHVPEKSVVVQKAEELAECLERFEYRRTVVVNHTDADLLPSDPCDRRDLNLVTIVEPSRAEKDAFATVLEDEKDSMLVAPTYTMTTHMLPRPAHVSPPANSLVQTLSIYQTTNPVYAPEKGSVLSVARMERAILTREGKAAVQLLSVPPSSLSSSSVVDWLKGRERGHQEGEGGLGVLQGAARREEAQAPGLWVVGSYAYRGIPLLEGCVAGAREVVEGGIMECERMKVLDAHGKGISCREYIFYSIYFLPMGVAELCVLTYTYAVVRCAVQVVRWTIEWITMKWQKMARAVVPDAEHVKASV
ncbi:hypothetical protein EW146_g481 [Bondarzewia mesenterica]|uniref:Micro-fibrillar-associated protein 1 C-terminal domain-containing protein n=1 Tax=Bondarzewia mesenterica TaxID=1095465 RepID=A0A4S4MD97_9AGAM|nr:hypothetical protein EW146_g481 [Bondarzewia mesenterica]